MKSKWSPSVILRYSLLQLPGIAFFSLIVFASYHLDFLPSWLAWAFWTVWMIKDITIYPLVWKAYVPELRQETKSMEGKTAITSEPLNPKGYVNINGESWKAVAEEGFSPISSGTPVVISRIHGLTLFVRPEDT
jgi:membrane protein implicated in regulation of membrane protease activity